MGYVSSNLRAVGDSWRSQFDRENMQSWFPCTIIAFYCVLSVKKNEWSGWFFYSCICDLQFNRTNLWEYFELFVQDDQKLELRYFKSKNVADLESNFQGKFCSCCYDPLTVWDMQCQGGHCQTFIV